MLKPPVLLEQVVSCVHVVLWARFMYRDSIRQGVCHRYLSTERRTWQLQEGLLPWKLNRSLNKTPIL